MKKIELSEKARKILKRTGLIAGGIAAFLLLLVIIVLIFINPIAKCAIQSIGSDVTGTEITVEDIDISIFSGEASISGLMVGCPEGYSAGGHTLKLGSASAKLDVGSLFSDELVINSVKLKDISVNHEQKDPKSPDCNFNAILANVEAYIGASPEKQEPETEGQKVRLEKVEVENVQVCAYMGNVEKTAVTITLEKLDAAPADGAAEITNLIVGNPPGFETNEFAVKLGNVVAGVDLETVAAEKLVIREVTLKDVLINYEAGVTDLSDNLNTLIGFVDAITGADQAPEEKPEDEESQKMQLDKLDIDNVKLCAFVNGAQVLGVPVSLPVLGPIGEDEEGLTGGEIISEVSKAIYQALVEKLTSVGGLLINTTGDGVKKIGEGMKDLGGDVKDSVKDGVKNLGDGVEDGVKNLGDGVKKIFTF